MKIRGKVESLSMVHKTLPDARRYRLVVIDEAHNLRNEKRRDHGVSSKDYIADNESRTLLLLTATPYNKEFADLASQLSLFLRPETDSGSSAPSGRSPRSAKRNSRCSVQQQDIHAGCVQALGAPRGLASRSCRSISSGAPGDSSRTTMHARTMQGRRYLGVRHWRTGSTSRRRIPKPRRPNALTEDDPAYTR